MSVVLDNNTYIFLCPHCHSMTQVLQDQVNCKIFRHAVFISNGEPINPHCPKEICDDYVQKKIVYGCAKPFRFVGDAPNFVVEICDYI